MYKGSDVIGKPIVSHNNGEILDKIKDIVFDSQTSKVSGFVVAEGGVFTYTRVLPFEQVKTIGNDAVIVESASAITRADEVVEQAKTKNVAKGTKIMSEDGRSLGQISDIYFDEVGGSIVGYEISGGVFQDAYKGKAYLSTPREFRIGEDVAFISNEEADAMESRAGGLKGVAQTAGDKMESVKDGVVTKMGALTESMQAKFEDFQDQAGTFSREKFTEYTVGKRAAKEVRADNGSILIAEGQIVSPDVVSRIESAGKERELLTAIAMGYGSQASGQGAAALSSGSDALKQGAGNLKDKVAGALGVIKDKTSEMKDKAQYEIQEKRIKAALGKPVTKVILDSNDAVILSTGELITNEVIERARKADVLDMLLDAVYKEEPTFSSDELKYMSVGQ